MAKRSGDQVLAQVTVVAVAVILALSLIASALQTWAGRFWLVAIFGGGGWLVVKVIRGRRERRRIRAQTLDALLALSPARFEHAVAQLLHDQGYRRVRVTGQAGDLQADVTARSADGRSVVVQCKRFAPGNKVGSPVVQSFIGMVNVHHRADRGMLVTTSTFTEPARKLARQHRLRLIDGGELVELIVGQQQPRRESTANEPRIAGHPVDEQANRSGSHSARSRVWTAGAGPTPAGPSLTSSDDGHS